MFSISGDLADRQNCFAFYSSCEHWFKSPRLISLTLEMPKVLHSVDLLFEFIRVKCVYLVNHAVEHAREEARRVV